MVGLQWASREESVEEFQVSTVNFDLSTGATASGAVNVATRSGTNELHGGGFLFFRDHHLSAYPALERTHSIPILSSSAGSMGCPWRPHPQRPRFFLRDF